MPRGISNAARAYAGPILWLVDITTRKGTQHFFADDQVVFAGTTYLPYLRLLRGARLTRSLQTDAAEIELLNADLTIGSLLATESFEGAACELKQLLLGLEEAVTVLRGLLTEQEEADTGVRFRLVSELDPAALDLHARRYAQLCTWPFGRPGRSSPCRYDPLKWFLPSIPLSQIGQRTADIFSAGTIGDTTLNEAANAHRDRILVITFGTGREQKRRIRSNTATTFTLYHPWATTPDASSRFEVFDDPSQAGLGKFLRTATAGLLTAGVTSSTLRSLTNSSLTLTPDEFAGDLLVIETILIDPTVFTRRIQTNDATTFTIEPDDFDIPGMPQLFAVAYDACPKDFAPSCEDRARTQDFNGFPTLVPIVHQTFTNRFDPGFDPFDFPHRGRRPAPSLPL